MTDKLKKSTGGKLLIRTGGFALSLPLVIALGGMLILINFLLSVLILGGLITGDTVVAPYLMTLTVIFGVGMVSMLILFRSVFNYTGGIGKLWQRLRGIQNERARIERLIDQPHHENETTDDTLLQQLDDESFEQNNQL